MTDKSHRCATIGHGDRTPDYIITYREQVHIRPVIREFACEECAEAYGRRPSLIDFFATPIPGDNAVNQRIWQGAMSLTEADARTECKLRQGESEVTHECARAIVRILGGNQLPALAFCLRGELMPDEEGPKGYKVADGRRIELDGGTRLYRLLVPDYDRLRPGQKLMTGMLGTYLGRVSGALLG